MRILFVSPQFPPNFWLFCRSLKEVGVTVLGLGDTHPAELAPDVARHLDDYAFVPDLHVTDEAIEAARALQARHGTIDAVESHNEHWLGLDARLRAALGAAGPTPDEVAAWQSKSRMGARFAAAGLDPPRTVRVQGPEEVRDFVRSHGLPVIVKPEVGVGAAGARCARNDAELAAILADDVSDAVVQEALTGSLVTYDGLAGPDGAILFASSFRYVAGVLELSRDGLDVVYHARRDVTSAIAEAGLAAVRAHDLRGRFFHVELFEGTDGRVRPLEINVRPPGGWSIDLMNFAADVDLYRLWARSVAGLDVTPVPLPHRYFAAHVGRRSWHRYRRTAEEAARELGPALVGMPDVPRIFGEAMGAPVFLIRHEDEPELERLIALVLERE